MAAIEFCVRAEAWCLVTSHRKFAVPLEMVQRVLNIIDESLNPLGVTATELREYLAGVGELALRVEMAGAYDSMHKLLALISYHLAGYDLPFEDAERQVIDDPSETVQVSYQWARTVQV